MRPAFAQAPGSSVRVSPCRVVSLVVLHRYAPVATRDEGSAWDESVFSRAAPDWMGVQRYDVPDAGQPGNFVYKVWVPVNSPLRDGTRTVGAPHHVEDVTPSRRASDARRRSDCTGAS
jgi:hypothetical protein